MSITKAVLLGIVQGLTEFLPISSSAHLVIFQKILAFNPPGLSFEIMVHVGTLAAVLLVFAEEVYAMLRSVLADIVEIIRGRARWSLLLHNPDSRLAIMVVIGSVPAAVAGIAARHVIEGLFGSVTAVGVFLLVTGTVLYLTRHRVAGRVDIFRITPPLALLIGTAQALALAPGISRSGMTISAGLLAGMKRDDAARFSFLLSLPAVSGAALVDVFESLGTCNGNIPLTVLLAGALAAAFSGYFAIRGLLRLVAHGRVHIFAYYTWALGVLVIIWQVLQGH
ncbi:MAG: undecaprenyl-diphosphate phosphatase [Bacillota bacterium]